jgi:hypothetical protein
MKRLELEPQLGPQFSRPVRKWTVGDFQSVEVVAPDWDVELGRIVDRVRSKEVPQTGPTFVKLRTTPVARKEPNPVQPYPYSSDEVQEIFEPLAERWEVETEFLSMTPQITGHPAYFEIVGLGPPAVPLILERLKKSTRLWFQALVAMTRENPAATAESHSAAAAAWLEWGRSRGLVD